MVNITTSFVVYAILGLIILAIFIGFAVFGNDLIKVIIEWFKQVISTA